MSSLPTARRLSRIRQLIGRIEDGNDVQARDLAIVLTPKQLKEMKAAWAEQKRQREEKKPTGITKYEKLLQQALLWHGKLDRYSSYRPKPGAVLAGRAAKADEIKNKCDRAFEDALEYLQEIAQADASLRVWFDRELDFSFDTTISIDPEGMPRVITSRSADNRSSKKAVFGLKSKTEIKLDALRAALDSLEFELLTEDERRARIGREAESNKLLREKLARLKKVD